MSTPVTGCFTVRSAFGCLWLYLALFLAASITGIIAAEESSRRGPDFGVILTDDGVLSFTDLDPQRSEAALQSMIRSLQGSPVRTLVYEVAAG